jgi:hypothetical protein
VIRPFEHPVARVARHSRQGTSGSLGRHRLWKICDGIGTRSCLTDLVSDTGGSE